MTPARLVQYARHRCSLCHDMDDALDSHFGDAISVERRDVDACPEWTKRYGWDVPVLTTESGEELCRHQLDVAAVRHWLQGPDASSARSP